MKLRVKYPRSLLPDTTPVTARSVAALQDAIEAVQYRVPWPEGYRLTSDFRRDIADDIETLFHHYVGLRRGNSRLETPSDPYVAVTYVLFRTLWLWRVICPEPDVQAIGRAIAGVHLRALLDHRSVCRSEFTFLLAWTGGVDWAIPFRPDYEHAVHGLGELRKLLCSVQPGLLLPLLFGHVEDEDLEERLGWLDDPAADGDPPCWDCAVHLDTYAAYVKPKEEAILASLWAFADPDGSGDTVQNSDGNAIQNSRKQP